MNDKQAKKIVERRLRWFKSRGKTRASVLDFVSTKLPCQQVERIMEKLPNVQEVEVE